MPLLFIAAIVAISAYENVASGEAEFPLFQFVRSGAPFFCGCIMLVGYRHIYACFERVIRQEGERGIGVLRKVMLAFAIGQLVQVVSARLGIPIANSMLGAVSDDRVSLFPSAAALLIFFYACNQRRLALTVIVACVLMMTGSKTVITTMAILWLAASLTRIRVMAVIKSACAVALVASLSVYAGATGFERLSNFVSNDQLEDGTRMWQSDYAKSAFYSGLDTIIFGNGLARPVTPGIDTVDPRWGENSKYEVEVGYWGLLAKLGILGTAIYGCMFLALPKNNTLLAIIIIESVSLLGSSSLFFTKFEGPYLLAWSIVVNYLLAAEQPIRGGIVFKPPRLRPAAAMFLGAQLESEVHEDGQKKRARFTV
jgi:hypothetical protein